MKGTVSEGVKAVGLGKTGVGKMLVLESEGKKYYKQLICNGSVPET